MNDTVARATRRGRRPTAADERDITERIHAAEAEARAALAEVPEASALLGRAAPSRAFKTRVVDVDRLEAALRAAEGCAPEAGPVQRARAAWDQAQGLRWTLAVSAADVVPREAHRVAKASGMDVEDLANEGYIGLLRAATRFDPDRGVRFASYARWWGR
ncbi:MAG: sigma factor, partial [Myxococcota bacterium]